MHEGRVKTGCRESRAHGESDRYDGAPEPTARVQVPTLIISHSATWAGYVTALCLSFLVGMDITVPFYRVPQRLR